MLIADPGIFRLCREVAPALPIHVSTQANTTNWSAVQFWKECGAERVVLAREVSLADAKEISANVDIELEGFVHGAMCISYSGRCLLSNYFTKDRDSNHGECVQCCRFKYSLVEEKRPGEYFPVMEDERGTYIFNSKDLCMLRHLPDLYDAGFASLKVEGRMKSLHYVATVVKVYREAMDAYEADPEHFTVKEEWVEELEKSLTGRIRQDFITAGPRRRIRYTGSPAIRRPMTLSASSKRMTKRRTPPRLNSGTILKSAKKWNFFCRTARSSSISSEIYGTATERSLTRRGILRKLSV